MHVADSHILVVDDVEDNRAILLRRLQRLGFRHLAEAEDGVAALDHIRAHPVDLVLLDVMMPRMNGVEVLEAIRLENRLEQTAVIMISASTEIETVVKCIDLGAEDYLPKPFNPSILRARIGSVLEKKALRAEVRRQLTRLEVEMASARQQQLAMVNTHFPSPGGAIDLHAVMMPAQEVGGDLYDFFEVTPGTLCIAIGDVSGKGMPAALFMARTRSLLRAGTLQFYALAGRMPRPSEVATLLNEELCKNNEDCVFVTLVLGFLDIASGRLDYVNAGHLPPFKVGADGIVADRTNADPPIGVMDHLTFADRDIQLGASETLVLMTDGLPEMENDGHELYTSERLMADCLSLAGNAARAFSGGLIERVLAHAGDAPQFDDITALVLRWRPPSAD
ncbi:Serine phosphatase RsbU, regulator of sigma subunit [Kaistia soli DSM 19436]|uniref:Serine phosphatase RsbU, regulator of sigma subunit n=1 Tax=Kaistia soli DSM 19436 TaxID=1122133 RepID=A0A1M5G293_9HYPH|nr:SpoIIE family protein phosphatase [Kaistia soli]SHF97947.1 Serine phosphatase RsbU, regulator of sigma subunit [Kaistia soli DSM 19436]